MNSPPPAKEKKSIFSLLRRTAQNLTSGIAELFQGATIAPQDLTKLEDVLIEADLGPTVAAQIIEQLKSYAKQHPAKDMDGAQLKHLLAKHLTEILTPVQAPLRLDANHKPYVVLFVGVNGGGKTTTLGKCAALWRRAGKNLTLAAGDTFRAAAVEQLCAWGTRAGVPVVTAKKESDPAAVAFTAHQQALQRGDDALLVDTAGRLHTNATLMEELAKIRRVLQKNDTTAPHATVLVLDATTGQNALTQAETFHKTLPLSGIIMTKLDGTAQGGLLVSLAAKTNIPIYALGVGENIDDLKPFIAEDFARALLNIS